jgi:hypothetical protein
MALMESRFEEAEKDLTFSFNNTPQSNTTNRRLILSYLVPVRLLLHQSRPSPTRRAALPSPSLLQKYKLDEFEKLVLAFRTGNVKLFDEALEENQDFYIKKAIYFLLHKLKLCVYRNLFKKAYNVLKKSQVRRVSARARRGGNEEGGPRRHRRSSPVALAGLLATRGPTPGALRCAREGEGGALACAAAL